MRVYNEYLIGRKVGGKKRNQISITITRTETAGLIESNTMIIYTCRLEIPFRTSARDEL